MAAPIGNKNGLGNNGGRKTSTVNQKKINTIKGLAFTWIEKVYKGKDEELKRQVSLKLINVIFPRELTGEDNGPIIVKWQK